MAKLTQADLQAALPAVSGTLRKDGLDGPIDIYRDAYGIPHVQAQSVHDAFVGQGFATAQDRLWHMDADRHRAYGRWAELVGSAGVEADVMMRKFRVGATAKTDYDASSPDTRTMLEAYASGVNTFINTTQNLPVEYRLVEAAPTAWQPWDAFAVFKMRHILMGIFEGKLWRAELVNTLGPDKAAELMNGYLPGHLIIVPPGAVYEGPLLNALETFQAGLEAIEWLRESPESGSNNWALSGQRTASGKPLLAGDPHRGLDTPNVYYQNHVACPDFDVIGLSFPGVPGFPHFGHNASVAWCVTHAQADYQDLYVERFHPDDPTQYDFQGEWQQADIQRETIHVKNGEPVAFDLTVTHHGPIISGDPAQGQALALRYTATAAPFTTLESIRQMLTSADADALDEAMRHWVDPCNNFVYADVHGNIGYLNRGQVPIRSMANAWLPVPGWTGEHEWQGHIPFEALVRSRNPETGCIVTANNRIADQDYPYYLSLDNAPEYRARRIWDRLAPLAQATVDDMSAIHAECVSIPAQIYLERLAEVEPLNDVSAAAKAMLSAWNQAMDTDTAAPTIYSAFRNRLAFIVIQHLLGDTLADVMFKATGRGAPVHMRHLSVRLNEACKNNDISLLPPGETWPSLMATALSEAMRELNTQFGEDMTTWAWGNVHKTLPKHILSSYFPEDAASLDPPSVSLGGDFDTPLAGSYMPCGAFTILGTSLARYVFDTADWDNSRWIVPLGSSGHPGSPHYADQTAAWAAVSLIPMTYDWDRIQADTESHQRLQ